MKARKRRVGDAQKKWHMADKAENARTSVQEQVADIVEIARITRDADSGRRVLGRRCVGWRENELILGAQREK
jgi:hypothetical protein